MANHIIVALLSVLRIYSFCPGKEREREKNGKSQLALTHAMAINDTKRCFQNVFNIMFYWSFGHNTRYVYDLYRVVCMVCRNVLLWFASIDEKQHSSFFGSLFTNINVRHIWSAELYAFGKCEKKKFYALTTNRRRKNVENHVLVIRQPLKSILCAKNCHSFSASVDRIDLFFPSVSHHLL